jgi:predicted PhzF superfamily epimerase YddE/YHI9
MVCVMGQPITIVDAFADRPFAGNPAAVCIAAVCILEQRRKRSRGSSGCVP